MLFLALGLALVAGAAGIDGSKLIDLSHGYGTETLYWPTGKPFEWRKTAWGMNDSGLWYAAAEFSTPEHSGTHIDAPIHFGQGQSSVDQIPVSQLIGPAAVVDIASKCAADPDYRLSRVDLEFWESAHGQIPDGAIVVARTGWYHRWPDRKSYMGSDVPGDTTHLHFPGFSKEAAQFLVQQRQIRGVGLDTASMDFGPSQDFIVHQVLNGANKYGLENLTNLDALPATGATLIVAPMKIEGGSGAPARIYALLP
jgi:kynurenine formamidase